MKFSLTLIVLLFLFSCRNKPVPVASTSSDSPQIIDIARDFKNKKEFRLSEIADDIEYIKLEKTPESLVGGGIPSWYITNQYIFVFSRGRLLQFSRDGKFIKQIGRNGRGPGEFQSTRGMVADESKNILYIIGNFKHVVLKYDINTGEFLGNFPINDYLGTSMSSESFKLIGNETFAAIAHPLTKFQPDYILLEIFDDKGTVLKQLKSSLFSFQDDKNVRRVHNGNNQIWFFSGRFRFLEGLNDTIYNIEGFNLEPAYVIELGKYKGPFDEMTTKYYDEIFGFLLLKRFWETQAYLIYDYFYNGESYRAFFDKTDGTFYQLTVAEDAQKGIINDLDGGLSFWPSHSVDHDDKQWIYWFDAIELKQKLTMDDLETSEAKFPEKKEQLKDFMEDLSIDDNPVLMIVKLKN